MNKLVIAGTQLTPCSIAISSPLMPLQHPRPLVKLRRAPPPQLPNGHQTHLPQADKSSVHLDFSVSVVSRVPGSNDVRAECTGSFFSSCHGVLVIGK